MKINGAGAGWVGQSPGLTRSLLKIECPAQAKPDVIHAGLDLTGGELEAAALLLLPTFSVVSSGPIPSPKQRSTERPLEAQSAVLNVKIHVFLISSISQVTHCRKVCISKIL